MAGEHSTVDGPANDNGGQVTASVIMTCIMAASGGLIFGYDIGVSGGVTMMESFLKPFFPDVLRRMADAKQDQFCRFNSEILTLFTSSLYLSGLVSTLFSSRLTKAFGRQATMLIGGASFLAGSAINAGAINIEMLIVGRLLLGFGIGFTNQSAPVYLAETAPPKWRGAFTSAFQIFIAIGVVFANFTNLVAFGLGPWGWRLSLGLAAIPASIILLSALVIPDTPSSLIYRGHPEAARKALIRIRGPKADIDSEIKDINEAVEEALKNEDGAFKRIVKRRYRPQLVFAVLVPMFQQLTGVIIIAFFAPVLFQAVGFGSNGALVGTVLLGGVNLGSVLVSMLVIDRFGRRFLFLFGGILMMLCLLASAWILGTHMGSDGQAALSKGYALTVLVLMCAFSAGFGFSWGPLTWVIPGEIFPVEIRSAGQSISVASNLATTFALTQTFLAMLCVFKEGIFVYFAAWLLVMTVFVALFLPETKGVPLESIGLLWKQHWYWKRLLQDEITKDCKT